MLGLVRQSYYRAARRSLSLFQTPSFATLIPRPERAQHNICKNTTTLNFRVALSTTAALGRIPCEDLPEKDGKRHYPFSGPLGAIRKSIQYNKHKKWGLLIYRCDYSSDDAWIKFLSNVHTEVKTGLEFLGGGDLLDTLEMTTMEDRETLDGATVDQVRDIFTEWVRSEAAKSELSDDPEGRGPIFIYPRYTYCIHVDAAVLDSVVNRAPQPPHPDREEIGYVNLVQLRVEDFCEGPSGGFSPEEEEGEEEEDFDENFVKVPLRYLDPELYAYLYNCGIWEKWTSNRRADGVSCDIVNTGTFQW